MIQIIKRKCFKRLDIDNGDFKKPIKQTCKSCNCTLSISNIDDITEEYGAVAYITLNESYILERSTLRRLILHNLKSYEWKALNDKYVKPHNSFKFMLHEDFYDTEGNALQPHE